MRRKNDRFALEHIADRLGLLQRQRREIRQGAFDDLLAFADRFAQQDRRTGIAIGDDVDVHGSMYST